MADRFVPAHELKYSDNIYWLGYLYTIIAVDVNYEAERIRFQVGYPRVMGDPSMPPLSVLDVHIQQQIQLLR